MTDFNKKELYKSLKNASKKRGYKAKGICIYAVKNDYLYMCEVDFNKELESKYIYSIFSVKPLFLVDLFWEIIDMESNKGQPFSLRINGAFAVVAFDLFSNSVEIIPDIDYEKITIDSFETFISNFDKNLNINNNYYLEALYEENSHLTEYKMIELLFKIHNEEYYDAMYDVAELMANNKFGNYTNEDKNIYEYILEYTQKKLGVYKKPILFSRIIDKFK